VSVVLFAQVREPAEEAQSGIQPALIPLRRIVEILRQDRNLSVFVAASATQALADIAAPFFVVYFKDVLKAPAGFMALVMATLSVTSMAAALFWGWFTDRYGARAAFVLAPLLQILPPLAAVLWGPGLHYMLFLLFGLAGGFGGMASAVAPNKFILDIAPPAQRMAYIGITNAVMGAVSLLYVVGGFVVQRWGLYAVFLVAAVCSFVASMLYRLLGSPVTSRRATSGHTGR